MRKIVCLLTALVFLFLGIVGCSTGEPTATPVPLNVVALEPNTVILEATEVVVLPTATPVPRTPTPVPPTATHVPPTDTPLPSSATPTTIPPTATPGADAATEHLRVTIVYDNTAYDPRLTADWGFAALVEYRGHTLLFDTGGNPRILMDNMELLEIDPMSIEAVVLSHPHGDHTEGLVGLAQVNAHPPVYVPPSFPEDFKRRVSARTELVEVSPGQEILPGVYTTGEMGSRSTPEQALVIRTGDGIVVITGCAHPGIVEMVTQARALVGSPVRLVLGGFHLGDKSASQIRSIIADFRQLGVEQVAPAHCTGERAIAMFAALYGDSYVEAGAGRVIVVESGP